MNTDRSGMHMGSLGRGLLAGSIMACAACWAPAARACQGPGHGIAWLGPTSVVTMEASAAQFDLADRSGSWFATTTALEYAATSRISLLARIPVAWIDYDSGASESGLADIEVGGKVSLLARPENRFLLLAGASLELPTGDTDSGLGGGHVELSPHVMASMEPLPGLMLHSVASDHLSLSDAGEESSVAGRPFGDPGAAPGWQGHPGHDHAAESGLHGSVLAPHTDHEMSLLLVAVYSRGRGYLSAGTEYIHAWSEEGGDPWIARTEAGLALPAHLMLSAGYDAPLAGEERFENRARLSLAWQLGHPSGSALGNPTCTCR